MKNIEINYQRNQLYFMAEMGMAIALMTILLYIGALIPIGTSGGVLNIGMPVIIFMSIRRGILTGIILGLVMGVVHAFEGTGYFISPSHPVIGLMLDYYTQYILLAFGAIWLLIFKFNNHKLHNVALIVLIVSTSFILALANETLSGFVAWTNGSTGWTLLIYCVLTNYPYLLATWIVTLMVLIPLFSIAFANNIFFIKPLPKIHRKIFAFKKNNLDKVV